MGHSKTNLQHLKRFSKVFKWQEQNKPLVNQQEEKLQENMLLLREQRKLQHLEELRNHTDIDLVLLLLEKSENTKSLLTFLSENYLSNVSNLLLLLHYKKLLNLILLDYLKILTYVLFMLNVLLSCQRIFNLLEESEENVL